MTGLVPGGPSQELDFTVNNAAAQGPQTISGVSVAVSVVSSPGTCDATDFSITQPNLGGSVALPVGDTTVTSGAGGDVANTGAAVAMVNKPAVNQNGCKGATLEFTYTVS